MGKWQQLKHDYSLRRHAKLLYAELKIRANKLGFTKVSNGTLMKMLNIKESCLCSCLAELEHKGYIERSKNMQQRYIKIL